MKKVFSLLMALMIVLSLATPAFASSVTVTSKDSYIFYPGSEYHVTDLFGDAFKNVMPGDTLTQEITIQGNFSLFTEDTLKVWLEAIAHDEVTNPHEYSEFYEGLDGKDDTEIDVEGRDEDYASMDDFLSQLNLKVTNTKNKKVLYDGPANGVFKKTLLGSFRKNGKIVLNVELKVPIELDNKYANRVGEVDWVFTVSGYEDDDNPKTGDYIIMGAAALLAVSGAALVVLLIAKKKRKA